MNDDIKILNKKLNKLKNLRLAIDITNEQITTIIKKHYLDNEDYEIWCDYGGSDGPVVTDGDKLTTLQNIILLIENKLKFTHDDFLNICF